MAKGDNLVKRLLARIHESGLQLTVHYPEVRPVATGTTPSATGPVSPLTGPTPSTTVFPTAVTPEKDPVTIDCLWLDSYVGVGGTAADAIITNRVGWVAGATALARVDIADAALEPDNYAGDTIFTAADHVEFQGRRYKVLAVEPVAASFRPPATRDR